VSHLNEFLAKLKAGDYVKVSDGGGRLSVDKVAWKTATQIVFVHDHCDGSQYVKRLGGRTIWRRRRDNYLDRPTISGHASA
jgi:3',5'-cyclic AMP phosphodiesterase CpdA